MAHTLWRSLALALVATLAPLALPASATVLKSRIEGAHYTANEAARVELNRMQSRLQNRNNPGALESAYAATRADSLSGEAWQALGLFQLRSGDYRNARVALQRAALLSPEKPEIWTRFSQVSLIHLGFEAEGVGALRLALEADSTYGPAWYSRGFYLWSRAELDAAERSIGIARNYAMTETQSAVWYSAQLGVLTARGEYAKAEGAIKRYRLDVPSDLTALQHLAHAQRGAGKAQDALDALATLRGTYPTDPLWLTETGHAYRALGRADSARALFTRAVALDSASFDAGYNRALELVAARDTARAWRELARLRRLDRQNWLVPLLASRIHRAAGDSARTRLAFEEARRLNPALGLAGAAAGGASIPAWSSPELEAAEGLIERGDFTLAIDRLYQAAQDSVRRAAALFWLAHVTRLSSSAPGPSVIAAQAGAEASEGDPVLVRALAEAQWAAGDSARAAANLATVRKFAPDDVMAAALLAEVLRARGATAEARAVFNEIALEPTRSWRIESIRAEILAATNDPGTAIARQRAAAADYLPAGGR